jgi:anti-sigma B factor antagonist
MRTNADTATCGPLSVETWFDCGRAVAEVSGEIDVYTVKQLDAAVAEVQKLARRPVLVLVLAGLRFCDSSGLGVMVAALKRARQAGGAVALVGVPEHLGKVLRVTGLDAILPVFKTIEDAFGHLDELPGGA